MSKPAIPFTSAGHSEQSGTKSKFDIVLDMFSQRRQWRSKPVLPQRQPSARGDTYGVVLAVVFLLLIGGVTLAFLLVSRPAPNTKSSTPPPATAPPAPPAASSNPAQNAALANGLAYSQSIAGRGLHAKGTVSPKSGGYSANFEYERAGDLERIVMSGSSFVRKSGGPWLHGNDSGAPGTPVSDVQLSLINDLLRMTAAPWNLTASSYFVTGFDQPNQQATSIVLRARNAQDPRDRLFVFRNLGSNLELERFSAPIGSGKDEIQLNLELSYPSPTPVATNPPAAAKAAPPKARPHRSKARP